MASNFVGHLDGLTDQSELRRFVQKFDVQNTDCRAVEEPDGAISNQT